MATICINTLIGIPASGKSSFCQKIQSEAKIFNVIHICYDSFIRMPNTDDSFAKKSVYFQSKRYKKGRFSLLWLLQQLIDDIKENTNFHKFRQAIISDFPHVNFDIKSDSTKEKYLLLIDDTMHYKSMRKEVRTIAKDNEIGFFVTFFHTTLDNAIKRNQNRSCVVDQQHLERMYSTIEEPTSEDGEIMHVNIEDEHQVTTDFVELFALKCIEAPLKLVNSGDHHVIDQSMLHKADLILRKSVNQKMINVKRTNPSVNLKELAKTLCAKRSFVLQEIKIGRINLPENLNDLMNFIDCS